MKVATILVLLVAMLCAVCASPFHDRVTIPRPRPGNPGFPNFPGQGAFNPRPWGRHRRSVESFVEAEPLFDDTPSMWMNEE